MVLLENQNVQKPIPQWKIKPKTLFTKLKKNTFL